MENAGLTGPVPLSIYNITTLKRLNLYKNHLSGILPWDMCFHLPLLEDLNLGGNQFTGSMPQYIGNCTFLRRLYFSENNLTGMILCAYCGKYFIIYDSMLVFLTPDAFLFLQIIFFYVSIKSFIYRNQGVQIRVQVL